MTLIWTQEKIRQNLFVKATELGLRMPQVQILLAQERFLARLAKSDFGTKYVWKGGSLLLRTCSALEVPRFTVDIDLLARGVSVDATEQIFAAVSKIDLEDGFRFGKITTSHMKRDLPYGGERFAIDWTFFGKNHPQPLQIDVAAGDTVNPLKLTSDELFLCPTDTEHFTYLVYPPEFIAAEKIETIFRFGLGNTRIKDMIDLWALSKTDIPIEKLKTAIDACFRNRQTHFDQNLLRSILNDRQYIQTVDEVLQRNFSEMQLPTASILLGQILRWCETLGA